MDFGDESSVEVIPVCDEALKPLVGKTFSTFLEAEDFYKVYAGGCGFDIRKGTQKKDLKDNSVVIRRYIYCNREGFHKVIPLITEPSSSKQERHRVSSRCGCMARISIRYHPVYGCVIESFHEGHSHELVAPEARRYMKMNRKLSHMAKMFNNNCAKYNFGPTRAFRFYKQNLGDYESIGSTAVDWKNYSRDRNAYLEGCDAQLVLRKMTLKQEACSAFYFAYSVDENDRLRCLFWADPIARHNYSVFGDVVSFDATYEMNKYKMIFAPFTGIDNHGKLVSFGAALLPGEDNTVYKWAFDKFKECMIRAPSLIITDQDPAIKIALELSMPESTHRLCMWHIMMKVPFYTPSHLSDVPAFKKKFNFIVWNKVITVQEFEEKWNNIMTEFGLTKEKWFCNLYDIREHWLPAYFRDLPMSGICRTTSISESVNNFFGHFLSVRSSLVEFMMHFDSAMDAQRETNNIMNFQDRNSPFIWKTPFSYEKHASTIYTISMFLKVQEDIRNSMVLCSTTNVEKMDECIVYEIEDGSEQSWKVTYVMEDESISCTCNKFVRDGLLCSHIFSLFKHLKWSCIPDKYVVKRWTKEAYAHPLFDIGDCTIDQYMSVNDNKKKMTLLMSMFYECVGIVEGDDGRTNKLMGDISNILDLLKSDGSGSSTQNKDTQMFEDFYGIARTDEIEVHPPLYVSTKGSGKRKKSSQEKGAELAAKPMRKCRNCGLMGHHDSRNCKMKQSSNNI